MGAQEQPRHGLVLKSSRFPRWVSTRTTSPRVFGLFGASRAQITPGSLPSSIPPCCLPRNAGREAEELEQAATRSLGTAGTPAHISWSTRSQGLTSGKGNQHLCPHTLSTPTPLISLSGAGKPPYSSPIKAGDEDFCAPAAFPHGTTQDTRRGPSPGYLRPVSGGALAEVGHVGGGDVTHGRFPKQPPG